MQPGLLVTTIVLAVGFLSTSSVGRGAEPDPQQIETAIQKGRDYLLKLYKPGSLFPGEQHTFGYACLAGMALLESGVEAKSPTIQNIAKRVRSACLQETSTYHASLCIMFLDRLGNPADRPLIQFLGVRLLIGQRESGGWSYQSGTPLTPLEEVRLRAVFKIDGKSANVKTRPDDVLPGDPKKSKPRKDLREDPKKDNQPDEDNPTGGRIALHPLVAKLLEQFQDQLNQGGKEKASLPTDNSNTQFAILGLWCAHRHGLPIEKSMRLLDKRFRTTQAGNGSWTYNGPAIQQSSSAAMTCAGLIGLAVSYGAVDTPKEARGALAEDSVAKAGFDALGAHLSLAQKPVAPKVPQGSVNSPAAVLLSNLYFLWSLERVGVIYGRKKIGNIDWYAWGAEYLVEKQTPDGSWTSNFAGSAPELNVSLGLLFLNRANVAKDLTAFLKGKNSSGEATLKNGGNFPSTTKKSGKPVESPTKITTNPARNGSDFDNQAVQLMEKLVNASGAQRLEIIGTLRDSKGAVYTEALKLSAAKLTGAAQAKVREALARRLARMTATTLREMFSDESREIRIAAATACGLKGDKQYIPDLIGSFPDKDPLVVQAIHASLVHLTGKDFGPEDSANDADRKLAFLAWRKWWTSLIK